MLTHLPEVASQLATTERTLRRAVERGLVRGQRVSPRKFEMSVAERVYLRENWPLLQGLTKALRTEPSIRAAILFGSYARGEQHEGSDIDILADVKRDPSLRAVTDRLSARIGIPVELVPLEDAERAPLLLAEVLRDGRVLVDRDQTWTRLLEANTRIERRASQERRRIDAQFADAFESAV